MNAKKIFKTILGVSTLVGTAYIAYQTGYQDGKMHHLHELLDDDDFDDISDSESHADEKQPESEPEDSDKYQETSRFKQLSEIDVEGISAAELSHALLIICQKTYIQNKILRDNLYIDDAEADKILDAFEDAGYVSEKNSSSGRKVYVNYSDYEKLCG